MKKYFLLCVVLSLAACGSSSSTTTTSSTTTDTTTAVAVPGDLVMASPTGSSSAAASISVKSVGSAAPTADYGTKRQALQSLIAASGECSFTLDIPTVTGPNCYGPTLDVCNHPDANVIDALCGKPTGTGANTGTEADDSQLPSGDLGIWSENEGTEACAAAKMNQLVGTVAARVDNSGTFTYNTPSGTFDNNNSSGAAVTPNLINISEVSFTVPTAPSSVD